jgi:Ca2+-binding RTX toxin-like protein
VALEVGLAVTDGETVVSLQDSGGHNFSLVLLTGTSETILGSDGANIIYGFNGNDAITGYDFADYLFGGGGNDTIDGGEGNDLIAGGAGNDVLTGGVGQDTFLFDALSSSVDTITGYTPSVDVLQLVRSGVFSGLTTTSGTLSAAEFESGAGLTAAATSAGRIVYNTTSGALYYDADGLGGTAAVQIAVLLGLPALSYSEFLIV